MARQKTLYSCTECGWSTTKWVGQCRGCQAWSTLEENLPQATGQVQSLAPATPAQPISQIDGQATKRRSTGVPELDRVLGGGYVPGAVVLLTGEPGVGKSTLLLEVSAKAAAASRRDGLSPVLYVTGEESASQVRLRAERINALDDSLLLATETDVSAVLGQVESTNPSLLIVDSVQTMTSSEVDGSAGGVAQVRAVAAALIAMAKRRNLPVILVGHVTKDGSIAGPRNLEHLVDVVCHFEGDRHARLRLLRSIKNRYGATDEVGCFEMGDFGIHGVDDPSGLFLSDTASDVSGTCVTVTVEGQRPMPTQVQALVAASGGGSPRRTTAGVDHSRVAMTLAVLQARAGFDLSSQDVYVSTVGGAKTTEPAVDAAVALALVSAATGRPPKAGLVAIGEVGLTGELRSTTAIGRRLAEAHRLGFNHAIVPRQGWDAAAKPAGMKVTAVDHIRQAIAAGLAPAS
ncbi:DNA repair protein RadA [Boudabousia marimammalium]|uniref:DNA repair protein RadA n=1 Tax=Boudabousia marimammalium TaxID=156892 RepID=A0A1Q5PMF0_9ACTO|nr:DNA repair protein RadA [Boudabousia marimammalium]OKL48699.1 DNA repair protein RadA [Boudabousia marimammalium]